MALSSHKQACKQEPSCLFVVLAGLTAHRNVSTLNTALKKNV